MSKDVGEIKTKPTALAQLIAIHMANGMTSTKDLCAETGYSDRAIRKAKAELECRNYSAARHPGAASPGTIVPQPEPECRLTRNYSAAPPRARAYKESPSEIVLEDSIPPLAPPGGQKFDWNTAFQDPSENHGVDLAKDGRVTLSNGTRQFWLERFGGDEDRLELALMQAAGERQPRSRQPLKLQIERSLARIAGQKRDGDQRYKSRTQPPKPGKNSIDEWRELKRKRAMEVANG